MIGNGFERTSTLENQLIKEKFVVTYII